MGFLSEGTRDWIAVIGLTIGIIQLVAACVGWLASSNLRAREGERPRVSAAAASRLRVTNLRWLRIPSFEGVPTILIVGASAFAVCLVGAAVQDIPIVGGVMLPFALLATLVQWGALMGWVLELIPERWDGSVERLTGILLALAMFGSGSAIGSWTLHRTESCANSNWICALGNLQAAGCIAISAVFGLSYAALNGSDWFMEWRKAARNVSKTLRR